MFWWYDALTEEAIDSSAEGAHSRTKLIREKRMKEALIIAPVPQIHSAGESSGRRFTTSLPKGSEMGGFIMYCSSVSCKRKRPEH